MRTKKPSLIRPVHVAISVVLGLAATVTFYYTRVVPQLAANTTSAMDEIGTGKAFSAITRDLIERENQIKLNAYAACGAVLPLTVAGCMGAFAAAARRQQSKAGRAS